MPTTEEAIAAGWAVAPRFGLAPESVELLSHSENVVLALDLGAGRRAALRLHRPGYNTVDQLRSEVAWVNSLGEFGLPVPTAVPADDGGHYVTVEVGGVEHHVGVVEWVPGAPLGSPIEAEGAEVVGHYQRIGQLAATIRAHHAQWSPPPGFDRRAWDLDGFLGEEPLWGRFWAIDALEPSTRKLFSECRDALRAELGALPTTPDHVGLIHADLHLGNLMADGDELTVIDFDDAGHGWFVYELAVALHPVLEEPWEDAARAALVAGYRDVHPLEPAEEQLIDTFLTIRSLMLVGWLDARRELPVYEYFPDLVAEAERMATRYLDGRASGSAPSDRP